MRGAPTGAEEKFLENDATWVALMEQAFVAPRYDSYFLKHSQLARTVWNRAQTLSPAIAVGSVWRHEMPNLRYVRIFSQIKIANAKKRARRGIWKEQ